MIADQREEGGMEGVNVGEVRAPWEHTHTRAADPPPVCRESLAGGDVNAACWTGMHAPSSVMCCVLCM